jgi:hypothetical protein
MGIETNDVNISNSTVLEATTLLASPSKSLEVKYSNSGLIAKVPAVISQVNIQIYVETTVKLDEPALEITNVTQNVYLNECELMQTEEFNNGKILINGYVRKNIEYATPKVVGDNSISSEKRYTTVNIPFKCFAKADFNNNLSPYNEVVPSNSDAAKGNAQSQLDEVENSILRGDRTEIRYVNEEKFTEKVTFELMKSKIRQIGTKQDLLGLNTSLNENTFSSFSEKMVIDITLMALQNQYVKIGSGNQSNNNGNNNSNNKNDNNKSENQNNDDKSNTGRNEEKNSKDQKNGKDEKKRDKKEGKNNKKHEDEKNDKRDEKNEKQGDSEGQEKNSERGKDEKHEEHQKDSEDKKDKKNGKEKKHIK